MSAAETVALAGLLALFGLGVGRGVMLSRRGVRVVQVDRERPLRQELADLTFVLLFLYWWLASVGLVLGLAVPPAWGRQVVLDSAAWRGAGVFALVAGLLLYASALRAFGSSWRLGIDRDSAGPLVTSGVFARSRNPIYLALSLVIAGSFLLLGHMVLLIPAAYAPVYFHFLIRREEVFLHAHYGDDYRRYAARVARWWTFGSEPT